MARFFWHSTLYKLGGEHHLYVHKHVLYNTSTRVLYRAAQFLISSHNFVLDTLVELQGLSNDAFAELNSAVLNAGFAKL